MKPVKYLFWGFLSVSVLLSACNNANNTNPVIKNTGVFRSANDCRTVENYVRDYAKRYQDHYLAYDFPYATPLSDTGGTTGGDSGSGGNPQADSGGMENHASSNVTQSDIAFPDPSRGLLYTFDQNKNLKTFQVEPIEQAQLLSTFSFDFNPQELVSVTANSHAYLGVFGNRFSENIDVMIDSQARSVLAILDLTNPSQPQKILEYELDGYFLDGRAFNADGKITWINQAQVNLDQNDAATTFPQAHRSDAQGSNDTAVVACADTLLYENSDADGFPIGALQYTFISSLDLKTMQMQTQALLSPSWNTLVSVNPQHLFLTQRTFDSETTELYQFDLNPLQLKASTLVEGEIPNQFFIGEGKNGIVSVFHYRNNWNFDFPNCVELCAQAEASQEGLSRGTYLSNYAVEGDKLVEKGRLGPLAPEERPFAARFSDHFGYVITYLQTDPLFVVDLSSPSDPKLLAEEKIDEVSYHLEEIPTQDNTRLLLGIGGLPQAGTVVANLFAIDAAGKASVADQLLLSEPNETSWSVIFSEYRGLGLSQDHQSFVVPIESQDSTALAYFSVDPVQKKLVALQKTSKPSVDYGDNYQRGYIFDKSLVGLSFNELELFNKNDFQKISTWFLQ